MINNLDSKYGTVIEVFNEILETGAEQLPDYNLDIGKEEKPLCSYKSTRELLENLNLSI